MEQTPPPAPGDARSGRLIALGAELEGLFDRLARRQGNVSLIQLRTLSALAAHDPDPLEPWEIERGFILTCQAVPMSQRLVLDYDQM